jgi:O-acetyl-ADP-ribose deacetylase (regulator of RNase III)
MAARIAVGTVVSALSDDARMAGVRQVVFCCFDREAAKPYEAAYTGVLRSASC